MERFVNTNERPIPTDCDKEVAKAKDRIFTNLSHEFRTPLNGIVGMTRLLADTKLTEEQQEYLNNLQKSTGRLLRLVENLLTCSELDTLDSPSPPACEPVNLEELIQESVILQKRYFGDAYPEVRVCMPETLDKWVSLDAVNLHLAMDQLIDNAVKFSGNQPVEIQAVQVFEQGEPSLRIDIRDAGIGMAPENISGLGEIFATQEDVMHKSIPGLGLGLSIAKKAALRGGMKMNFHFDQPQGTHVSLMVPAQWSKPLEPDTYLRRKNQLNGRIRKVLIVDDDETSRILMKMICTKLNMTCELAKDGQEAIRAVEERYCDLILMDIQMPEVDGAEALLTIREKQGMNGRRTPVIAVTAYAMWGDKEKFLNMGFDGYISKPVEFENCAEVIGKVMERV